MNKSKTKNYKSLQLHCKLPTPLFPPSLLTGICLLYSLTCLEPTTWAGKYKVSSTERQRVTTLKTRPALDPVLLLTSQFNLSAHIHQINVIGWLTRDLMQPLHPLSVTLSLPSPSCLRDRILLTCCHSPWSTCWSDPMHMSGKNNRAT